MSLKDCISNDIENVFMNVNDFCDYMVIHIGSKSVTCKGSLQSNKVYNNSGNGQPLQENSWTLYIKYPIAIHGEGMEHNINCVLSAGTRIAIDDKSFTVVDVSDEMGLATINLTTRNGR